METLVKEPSEVLGEGNNQPSLKRNKPTLAKWYRWHRKIGIIILIPVIMWCLSGLMHPIMARWIKVEIPNRFVKNPPLHENDFGISLQEALIRNGIAVFSNVNIVRIGEEKYYQVLPGLEKEEVLYLNTKDGSLLADGDKTYAIYLARYFMDEYNAEVSRVSLVKLFTPHYKFINRLLPVYKVSLERPDQLDVYVHTRSSRLGTANDRLRKGFMWLFANLHNWDFLKFAGPVQPVLMTILLILIFFSAASGLYIYSIGWKRFKKQTATNTRLKKRKWHRVLGLGVSLSTLCFSFSGAYHLLYKHDPFQLESFKQALKVTTEDLKTDPFTFINAVVEPTVNLSFSEIDGQLYYRFAHGGENRHQVSYFSVTTGEPLENGDMQHAKYLAGVFSGLKDIQEVKLITRFGGEYGFVNKRLPVYKVSYNTADNHSYYVETSTGRLAAKVTDPDRWEGFSFAFLHKYHTLDFAGKDFRDLIMSLAALGLLTVSLFGLVLYIKY